jgi:signal transduction histidine kinase
LLALHTAYALIDLFGLRFETPMRVNLALGSDTAYFLLWTWLAPHAFPPVWTAAFLLIAAALQQTLLRAAAAAGVALLAALGASALFEAAHPLPWTVAALAASAVGTAIFRNFLEGRMSTTLRQNLIIRAQAQGTREAERQRIAADFHDGPLQNFVGFQMRLEYIRRMLQRNAESGMTELLSLQELCKSQVTDLRQFVRSMRPPDEGMSLAASLARMAESLQRDTGIQAQFTSSELRDPAEPDVSLAIIQMVREAFNNIQKHSGATRVEVSAHRRGRKVEIVVQDNGGGFPFAGAFDLEELDAARLGPISIKRRIRSLAGDLDIVSRPGSGATLTLRVPF